MGDTTTATISGSAKIPRSQLTDLEAALYEALKAAEEQLDYCGYGDSWEREGAIASKLPEKIAAALALVDGAA